MERGVAESGPADSVLIPGESLGVVPVIDGLVCSP